MTQTELKTVLPYAPSPPLNPAAMAWALYNEAEKIDRALTWCLALGGKKVKVVDGAIRRKIISNYENHFCRWASVEHVETLVDLMYAPKSSEFFERLFAKSPIKTVLTGAEAKGVWTALGKTVDLETWYRCALMGVVTGKKVGWADGHVSVDMEALEPKNQKTKYWVHRMAYLLKYEYCVVSKKHNWWDLITRVTRWMDGLSSDDLRELSIPLVRVGSRLYVESWWRLEQEMIENLKWYLSPSTSGDEDKDKPVAPPPFVHENSKEKEDCVICLKQRVGRLQRLTCGHTYHAACLGEWLKEQATCPLCRAEAWVASSLGPEALEQWMTEERPDLMARQSPEQLAALRKSVDDHARITVIQGAGGTGKTEAASVLGAFEKHARNGQSSSFLSRSVFIAPTGKATVNVANRLDAEQFQVSSIHSWLISMKLYPPSAKTIPYMFVDEASMLDLWLTSMLLECARAVGVQRIVFFGDRHQLPPINDTGTLLGAFCTSTHPVLQSRTATLTTNFRTRDSPGLLGLFSKIRFVMEDPSTRQLKSSDFNVEGEASLKIIPNGDQNAIAKAVLSAMRDMDATPLTTRILSTKRSNQLLLDPNVPKTSEYASILRHFNPRRRGACQRFSVGDYVLSKENVCLDVYNDGRSKDFALANGSEGVVEDVAYDDWGRLDRMAVRFHGRVWRYPSNMDAPPTDDPQVARIVAAMTLKNNSKLDRMFETLAFASISTAHCFQGSEAQNIIAVCGGGGPFHTGRLLYTLASRARERLHLIADETTIKQYTRLNMPMPDVKNSFLKRFEASLEYP